MYAIRTINHNGTTINLTNQAVMDNYGTNGGVRYYAHGTDADGNEYRVAWDTTAEFDDGCRIAYLRSMLDAPEDRRWAEQSDDDIIAEIAEIQAKYGDNCLPDGTDDTYACDWDNPADVSIV